MEGRTDLVEAAANPDRRRAQALISEPRDTVVVVEGRTDFEFFKSNGKLPHIRYAPIYGWNGTLGKRGVIKLVSEDNEGDYYGIVDMDYDFDSSGIADSSRLVDTSRNCCLFSSILEKDARGDAMLVVEAAIARTFREIKTRARIIAELRQSERDFIAVAEEITVAKLFRGSGGAFGPEGEIAEWGVIKHDMGAAVSHLIPPDRTADFAQFKKDKRAELRSAGLNDHAVASVALNMIESILEPEEDLPDLHELERSIAIEMANKGSRDSALHFLRILDIEANPRYSETEQE